MLFGMMSVRNVFVFSLYFVSERRAQSQWNWSLLLNLAHSVLARIKINYDSPFPSKTSPTESVKISPTLPITMVHLGPDCEHFRHPRRQTKFPNWKRIWGNVSRRMNNESKGQTSASSVQLETKITHQCLLIKHKLFIVLWIYLLLIKSWGGMWEIKHSNIISARETTISTPSWAYSRKKEKKKIQQIHKSRFYFVLFIQGNHGK